MVDDEDVVRRMTTRLLSEAGYSCLEASTSAQALDAVAAGKADAMVLDLILGAENGWEVLRRTLELTPLPILLVTGGDADDNTLGDALALGARGVLRKPFDAAQIKEAVARLRAPGGAA